MMKHAKKLVGILLAMVMVLGMSMTVFAANVEQTNLTITIHSEVTGHTYNAYEIFAGDISSNTVDGTTKLSNIEWGAGVSSGDIITDLYGITSVKNAMDEKVNSINTSKAEGAADITKADLTAEQVAECLSGITAPDDLRAVAKAFNDNKGSATGHPSSPATDGYTITGLSSGYYLVVDTSSTSTADDAYSALIVNLVGNTTVTAKVAKPTVDKDVQDEAADKDKTSTDSEGWGKTADRAINETFAFKLTASLPADTDFAAYATYKVVFTDTMSGGVAFENIVSVTVDGQTVEEANYTLSDNVKDASAANAVGGAGALTTWNLTIDDIKSAASGVDLTDGAEIIVTYNAHLTEKATVTATNGTTTDNENSVKLTYSNNPTTGGTGETTEKKVYVFTFEVDNTKYADDTTHPLGGAEFTLYESDGTTVIPVIYDNTLAAYRPIKTGETATVLTSAETTGKFDIKGLDAGTYVLKETKTPDGYNTVDPITVIISAEHQMDGTTPKVTLTSSQNTNNSIIDKSGAILPSTGGMGTTIFYVIGSVMVLGAAVLLITKKRMNAEK